MGKTYDRMATLTAIRAHLRALDVNTDHLSDDDLEKRVVTLNRGLQACGVQMREAAKTVSRSLNADRKQWFRENLAAPVSEGES